MNLIVLGSGTSVPHAHRASAGFWLETEAGTILLDCSADTAHRMAQENLEWANLDTIWISHLHLDHCGGLAPLLVSMKWAPQTESRTKPLKIFACAGLGRVLHAIDTSNDYGLFKQRFPIALHEFESTADFMILPGVSAQTFSTPHTTESLALRITDSLNKSVVYSSDTGYSEELSEFAHDADLLILECSFWKNKPTTNHLKLADSMRLAERAAPRKLLLTHLYPEWDNVEIEAKAREMWAGQTVAAHDGLRIEI